MPCSEQVSEDREARRAALYPRLAEHMKQREKTFTDDPFHPCLLGEAYYSEWFDYVASKRGDILAEEYDRGVDLRGFLYLIGWWSYVEYLLLGGQDYDDGGSPPDPDPAFIPYREAILEKKDRLLRAYMEALRLDPLYSERRDGKVVLELYRAHHGYTRYLCDLAMDLYPGEMFLSLREQV